MSDPTHTEPAGLKARLDAIARRGSEHIVARRDTVAFSQSLRTALLSLFVVPAVVVFIQLVQAIHGMAPWDVNGWLVLLLTLASPVVYLIGARMTRETEAPSRAAALGLFDAEGEFADRLNAADEFLEVASEERGDFMQAAIEDAEAFAGRADQVTLPETAVELPDRMESLRLIAAALLLCVLAGLVGEPAAAHLRSTDDDGTTTARVDAGERGEIDNPKTELRETPPPVKEPESEETNEGTSESKEMERAPAELKEAAKKTHGRTGAGQASDAESTSGANDARGSPTEQSTTAKSQPKKKSKPVKKPLDKKKVDDKREQPKKMASEESGSTAGRGSARGSNKNPVTSSWKSKDQVDPDDEDEIEDDEDVEDEESDSEARGGMQPNLRDRRPPVSRDLSIGFGNQPNPDANGRGGPSEQKKSRGTASLVLGVPIPDRVKGQPNPGKAKVTQERVEPRRETAPGVNAGARTARDGAIGRVSELDLSPWMRDIIRRYFTELRQRNTKGAP